MNCLSFWCTHTQRASRASFTWNIWTGLSAARCQGCDNGRTLQPLFRIQVKKNSLEKKKKKAVTQSFKFFCFSCCIMLCRMSGGRDYYFSHVKKRNNEEVSFSLPSTQKHFPPCLRLAEGNPGLSLLTLQKKRRKEACSSYNLFCFDQRRWECRWCQEVRTHHPLLSPVAVLTWRPTVSAVLLERAMIILFFGISVRHSDCIQR